MHAAKVSHHIKGRMRVKVPAGKRNIAVLNEVSESLCSLPGVRGIQMNAATGSILVEYDHNAHTDFHQTLIGHGTTSGVFALAPPELSEVDQLAANIQREADFLAAHSETARSIVDACKAVNEGLKRATGNNLDLKVLLPLGLAVWALIEHDPEIATPLWLTLGIFSFNSFVSLHTLPAGVTVATQSVITPEEPPSLKEEVTPPQRRPRKRT